MIAGLSYNIFNGEEHLLHSLRNIRPCVDYINIVVQRVSNVGEYSSESLEKTLDLAKRERLFDELYEFTPDFNTTPSFNEFQKRSIGLSMAKKAGVTHFMTMDADEYYVRDEFFWAKQFLIDERITTSAVATYLHIKRPIWRSQLPDTTCCAFLTKLEKDSELTYSGSYPVLVDPTRRLRGDEKSFHFFDPATISMRHMNLVRKDNLASKLKNSSSAHATEFMQKVREAYDTWSPGSELHFPNKPPMEIIEVPDLFGIDPYFRDNEQTGVAGYLNLLRRFFTWHQKS